MNTERLKNIIKKGEGLSIELKKAHHFGFLTPNSFEPFPKNPDIARIFTQIGHSEELGTGIRNVYRYTKPYSESEDIVFKEEDVFLSEVSLKLLRCRKIRKLKKLL